MRFALFAICSVAILALASASSLQPDKPGVNARFEISRDPAKKTIWYNVVGANNEKVCTSETYSDEAAAVKGIVGFLSAAASLDNINIVDNRFVHVVAKNNEKLCNTEEYTRKGNAEKAKQILHNVARAQVEKYLTKNGDRSSAGSSTSQSGSDGQVVQAYRAGKYRFEIVKTGGAQPFHTRLVADNGNIIIWSENLSSIAAAYTNLAAMILNGSAAAKLETVSAGGSSSQHEVRLFAENGKILGNTENYKAKAGAANAREAVHTAAREILAKIAEKATRKSVGSSSSGSQ